MFKVAILMATFNGERWISEQILSIFSQVDVEVSLFISDDGSTDATLELINKFRERECPITVLEKMIDFGAPARNFFRLVRDVDCSNFDFIFFADQDDIWETDKVKRAISEIKKNGADCYASDLIAWFPDGRESVIKKSYSQKSLDYLFQGASAGCTYGFSCRAFLVLKVVISSTFTALPKSASHDWLSYAITRSRGFVWIIDSKSRIRYRQHDKNVYGGSVGFRASMKRLQLLRNKIYKGNIKLAASYSNLDDYGRKVVASIDRFNFDDRLFLARNAWNFRRKFSESLMLAALFIFGAI